MKTFIRKTVFVIGMIGCLSLCAGCSSAVQSETQSEEATDLDEDKLLTREELQERYDIYHLAREYYMDPEELTDAFVEGINSDRFDPFANTQSYSKEEWESLMTERYGDDWENW